MKNLLFFLVLVLLLLSACAPNHYYVFEPVKTDRWDNGKAMTQSSSKTLEGSLSYSTISYNQINFELELLNTGDKPIVISSDNFYYLINTDSLFQIKALNINERAINPDDMILKLERERYSEANKHCILSSCNLLLSLGDLASSHKNETYEERKSREKEEKERQEQLDNDQKNYEESMNNYKSEIKEWENSLRKTTLDPGKSVKGTIHFKCNHDLFGDFSAVVVKTEDESLIFKFQKVKKSYKR